MKIVYNESTGYIQAVGNALTSGYTLVGGIPDDFARYFVSGKYLGRSLSATTAEIYLNDEWTPPSDDVPIEGATVGKTLYVDQVYGDDSTATPGSMVAPFKTLTAAKDASSAWDTIIVRGGTYNERNLLKNHVDWVFQNSTIQYTGVSGAIFDNSTGGANEDVYCRITGSLDIINTNSSPVSIGFNLPRLTSFVQVDISGSITSYGPCVSASSGVIRATALTNLEESLTPAVSVSGTAHVHADRIQGYNAFSLSGDAQLECYNMVSMNSTSTGVGGKIIDGSGTINLCGRLTVPSSCSNSVSSSVVSSLIAELYTNKPVDDNTESSLVGGFIEVI